MGGGGGRRGGISKSGRRRNVEKRKAREEGTEGNAKEREKWTSPPPPPPRPPPIPSPYSNNPKKINSASSLKLSPYYNNMPSCRRTHLPLGVLELVGVKDGGLRVVAECGTQVFRHVRLTTECDVTVKVTYVLVGVDRVASHT